VVVGQTHVLAAIFGIDMPIRRSVAAVTHRAPDAHLVDHRRSKIRWGFIW
jgi:hypothetical protein